MAALSAAVILLVAVVLAISSGGASHRRAAPANTGQAARKTEIGLAAEYLGVPAAVLRRDLRSGRSLAQVAHATPGRSVAGLVDRLLAARVAALRASGRHLSAAELARRVERLRVAVTARVNRGGLIVAGVVSAADVVPAAEYLGIDVTRLRGDLEAGRTLAQVAESTPGRSSAGLIAALVASRTAKLQAAVTAGTLNSSQERELASGLARRVTAEVRAQSAR